MQASRSHNVNVWQSPVAARSVALRYTWALALVAAALTLRLAAGPEMAAESPFITLFGAVALSAWVGGIGPGLITMTVGYVLTDRLVHAEIAAAGDRAAAAGSTVSFLLFALSSGLILLCVGATRRARCRLHENELRLAEGERRLRDAVRESSYPLMLRTDCGEVLETSRPWRSITSVLYESPKSEEWAPVIHTKQDANGAWDLHVVPLGWLPDGRRVVLNAGVDVTERIRSQEALRKHSDRLDLALDSARMVAWEFDLVTERMIRTPNAEHLMALECESDGSDFLERVHPEDRNRVKQAFERGIAGQHYEEEYRVVKPGGTVRWFADRSRTIVSGDGTPVRVSGISIDITDRKLAEFRLDETKRRSREIADKVPAHIWVEDESGTVLFANKQCLEFSGCSAAELSSGMQNLVHADDVDRYLAGYRQAVAQQREHRSDVRLRRHDGAYRWLELLVTPRFEGNRFIGYAGCGIDMTERHAAEQAVRQSEAKLQAILDNVGTLVYIKDPEGRYLFVNRYFEQALRLPRSSILLKTDYDLFPRSVADQFRANDLKVLESRTPITAEEHGVFPDYSGDFLSAKFLIPDSSGRGNLLCGVSTDITEQRRITDERTRSLASEQTARAEAERANRMKDEFLAILSHELRTPLNAILGWAQLIDRKRTNEAVLEEGISAISRNARAQAQLIEDLLDLSRIVSGKFTLQVTDLDFDALVDDSIRVVSPSAEAKGVALSIIRESAIGRVRGDGGRLQQAIWNLLTNAMKFTPAGGRIEVHTSCTDSKLVISVKDSGEGIHASFLPNVFEGFRQADSSTTRKFGGLGIGLAVSKQIVEQHGGTISAASDGKDRGSTFTITIPVVRCPPCEETLAALHAAGNLRNTRLLSNLEVLVVDDEPDALALIAHTLRDAGANVRLANTASEAFDLITDKRPDVIISDIAMPNEDGYELIRRVRALTPENGGRIPAAALTAFARLSDKQRALNAGFQLHLSKPIEPAELVNNVASLAHAHAA